MRHYATHIALLVQSGNKQRIHGKVTEWGAVTVLIKITSELPFCIQQCTLSWEDYYLKYSNRFSDISNC